MEFSHVSTADSRLAQCVPLIHDIMVFALGARPSIAWMVRHARHSMHDITGGPSHPAAAAMGASVGMPVPSMTIASTGLSRSSASASPADDAPRL